MRVKACWLRQPQMIMDPDGPPARRQKGIVFDASCLTIVGPPVVRFIIQVVRAGRAQSRAVKDCKNNYVGPTRRDVAYHLGSCNANYSYPVGTRRSPTHLLDFLDPAESTLPPSRNAVYSPKEVIVASIMLPTSRQPGDAQASPTTVTAPTSYSYVTPRFCTSINTDFTPMDLLTPPSAP